MFTALTDRAGMIAHRRGALERVQLLLEDWHDAHRRLADTETRMTAVLDELKLTELITWITGISPVGAAAILAQTGDPRRFATARALVKHAGLAPREKLSGAFVGRTKLTGQGRPGLRLAAWRTVWGAQRANPVYAARYRHLTTREHNKLCGSRSTTPAGRRPCRCSTLGVDDTPYPFLLFLSQAETEAALATHLADHGVLVERGTELVGLTSGTVGCSVANTRRAVCLWSSAAGWAAGGGSVGG